LLKSLGTLRDMPLPLLPVVVDLWELTEDTVDIGEGYGRAIVQEATYQLDVQLLDDNGDPFDLGPTNDPDWEVTASLRGAVYDEDGGTADLTFTCTVDDGPLGLVQLKATPTQTAALAVTEGRWDMDVENLSASGYDVGYKQMVFRGKWRLLQDVTR
jgi:hypothetical protein